MRCDGCFFLELQDFCSFCGLLQTCILHALPRDKVAASIRQYRLGDAEGYRILLILGSKALASRCANAAKQHGPRNMTNSSLQLAGLFVFVHRRQDISQELTKKNSGLRKSHAKMLKGSPQAA